MNDSSNPDRVAIVDLADDLQVRKQRIFKILPRLGIKTTQRREPSRKNQMVATVTPEEAATVRFEILKSSDALGGSSGISGVSSTDDIGFFYVIQLEPDLDPRRLKVGFTMDLDGRLQKHRCAAPFAEYSESWPCRRAWERTAMDCVIDGCEQIHTEVFRAVSLEAVIERAEAFFALMPRLEVKEDEGECSEASEAAS